MNETPHKRRLPVGEVIAFAALIVSAFGVWIAWESSRSDEPTRIVEQRQPIALTLRAKREDYGTRLNISPVESSHALEGITITIPGTAPISVGSDGDLEASDVESALKGHDKEPRDQTLSVPARVESRYVEMGKERKSSGPYTLRYQWKTTGLFRGRSLRLVSLSR